MELRNDDPIYYRNKILNLLNQAFDKGLELNIYLINDGVKMQFKADNGDRAELIINQKAILR